MAKVVITGIAGGFGKPTALALLDRRHAVAGSVRSRKNEKWLTEAMLTSRIHRRKPAGKPMPPASPDYRRQSSRIRPWKV